MNLYLVILILFIFILAATSYLPKRLVRSIERQNEALRVSDLNSKNRYFIFVLAAGYEHDEKLPALGQLNQVSLGRLVEGIRIFRCLGRAVLVTSGCTFFNTKSQASVTKEAACELGVDDSRIETLETASNTKEEAQAFFDRFGDVSNLILVTDALHMPRALKIFKSFNINPIAAPTNYRVKFGVNSYNGFTLPRLKSLILLRYWFNEKLKTFIFKISQ